MTTAPPLPPISTIYVSNLNTKIRKEELRKCLYSFFSTYGQVVDVVALRTASMRGQAHVVFAEPQSAQLAARDAAGKSFLSQSMRIDMARQPSAKTKIAFFEGFGAYAEAQEVMRDPSAYGLRAKPLAASSSAPNAMRAAQKRAHGEAAAVVVRAAGEVEQEGEDKDSEAEEGNASLSSGEPVRKRARVE
ncbi:hypothetical protein BC828DRAFT_383976 [Blastocladiella britannica]|nr:hypothetical protein BC828DRAFT_383976 [Blastocladiella britannica]